MNKIFSSFITSFFIPMRHAFKKSAKLITHLKLDTFLGGLIIGAVFSLIVNIITLNITDDITKQRALEALENEILLNTIRANTIVNQDNKEIANKAFPNPFYTYPQYDDNVWSNSLTTQYLEQIDPNLQSRVNLYYEIQIKGYNSLLDNLNAMSRTTMQNCFDISKPLTTNQKILCESQNATFVNVERESAITIAKQGFALLSEFHPTRDRLHDPFLVFLMGNKAVKVLSQ